MEQAHEFGQLVVVDVAAGDGEGVGRQGDCIDLGLGEVECGENGEATGTGAQMCIRDRFVAAFASKSALSWWCLVLAAAPPPD